MGKTTASIRYNSLLTRFYQIPTYIGMYEDHGGFCSNDRKTEFLFNPDIKRLSLSELQFSSHTVQCPIKTGTDIIIRMGDNFFKVGKYFYESFHNLFLQIEAVRWMNGMNIGISLA